MSSGSSCECIHRSVSTSLVFQCCMVATPRWGCCPPHYIIHYTSWTFMAGYITSQSQMILFYTFISVARHTAVCVLVSAFECAMSLLHVACLPSPSPFSPLSHSSSLHPATEAWLQTVDLLAGALAGKLCTSLLGNREGVAKKAVVPFLWLLL